MIKKLLVCEKVAFKQMKLPETSNFYTVKCDVSKIPFNLSEVVKFTARREDLEGYGTDLVNCSFCNGTGRIKGVNGELAHCPLCGGRGYVEKHNRLNPREWIIVEGKIVNMSLYEEYRLCECKIEFKVSKGRTVYAFIPFYNVYKLNDLSIEEDVKCLNQQD